MLMKPGTGGLAQRVSAVLAALYTITGLGEAWQRRILNEERQEAEVIAEDLAGRPGEF